MSMLLEQIEKRYASDMYAPNMAAAFVLYLIKRAGVIDVENLSAFLKEQKCDPQLARWIESCIDGHWNEFRRLIAILPEDWLREYILFQQPSTSREAEIGSADSLCDLVIELMQCSPDDRVLDPCCGVGTFMVRLAGSTPVKEFCGYDLAPTCVYISKIRASVLGIEAKISNGNALDERTTFPGDFDKIFIEPPFGQRLAHTHMIFNTPDGGLPPAFPMVKSTNSTEWIWVAKMLGALKAGGKIAMLVSNGALFNMTEAPLRRYLVDRGHIEAVIALPEKMLSYSNIGLSLVIITKESNSVVKMIDASQLCERGVKGNTMPPSDRSHVVDLFSFPNEGRVDVKLSEIADNDYKLSAPRYFMPKVEVQNGYQLKDLCNLITRGASFSREEFNRQRDNHSAVRCLTVGDVQDGIICDTMPSVDCITPPMGKRVDPGDVVLTKAMAPYKVAVAEVKEGDVLLATSNFYILKLKKDRINPYFLMGYLTSENGKLQMEKLATGTTIRTIGQESLERVMIPVPPIQVQNTIADEFRQKLNMLAETRREYDRIKNELESVYDNFEKKGMF